MKTLDEVITALTICKNPDINRNCKDCPMPDTQECMGVLMTDALHYLKWFKARDEMSRKLDREDKEPLTFDEIRNMLGQPVWMEWNGTKGWRLVNWFDSVTTGEKAIALTDRFGVDFVFTSETIKKCGVEVYRKEHHENAR